MLLYALVCFIHILHPPGAGDFEKWYGIEYLSQMLFMLQSEAFESVYEAVFSRECEFLYAFDRGDGGLCGIAVVL